MSTENCQLNIDIMETEMKNLIQEAVSSELTSKKGRTFMMFCKENMPKHFEDKFLKHFTALAETGKNKEKNRSFVI